jgi:hypothetical protein
MIEQDISRRHAWLLRNILFYLKFAGLADISKN